MNIKRARFFFIIVAVLNSGYMFSQQSLVTAAPKLARGIQLYGEGKWGEAIIELRQSQSETADSRLRAEAQFWIAICELQAGDYTRALHDIEEFQRIDPKSPRVADAPYHKARALFYLERYNEALPLFKAYADSIRVDGRYANGVRVSEWSDASNALDNQDNYNRKASAVYWVGECLYALEQYDEAEAVFSTIITQYVRSHKYEASVNRIALIKEKRTLAGLLDIVNQNKQSPSQNTAQMDAAVSNYQRQLGSIVGVGTYSDNYQTGTTPSMTIQETQGSGRILVAPGVNNQSAQQGSAYDPNKLSRLLSLKTTALEMMDRLVSLSASYEIFDGSSAIGGTGTILPQQQNGSGRITTWQ